MKFRVEYNGKAKLCKSGEDALAEVFFAGAGKDVLTAVGEWCDSVEKDSKTHAGMQFTFDWKGYHLETERPVRPEPPRPEKPKGPTEFILKKLYPKTGWCLFKLAGRTENSANEELARAQGLDPFGQYRVEEVVSADCWWNDPFLAN